MHVRFAMPEDSVECLAASRGVARATLLEVTIAAIGGRVQSLKISAARPT